MDFEYKCITSNNLVILSLKGKIGREAKDSLSESLEKILNDPANHVLILFKDVTHVELASTRDLAMLQQEIRKSKKLYLVGLNKDLKIMLLDKGIIRERELRNSLEEALKTLEITKP